VAQPPTISAQYLPELHYLVFLRAEVDLYKVILTAHWSQIFELPENPPVS